MYPYPGTGTRVPHPGHQCIPVPGYPGTRAGIPMRSTSFFFFSIIHAAKTGSKSWQNPSRSLMRVRH
eukprot:2511155-Rhodomonas_salina.1